MCMAGAAAMMLGSACTLAAIERQKIWKIPSPVYCAVLAGIAALTIMPVYFYVSGYKYFASLAE